MHINPIGLIRMGSDNMERFSNFNSMLNTIQEYGGNIAVPSYSYSYTKNDVYDILNTPSDLGGVSEFLRKNNKLKRTLDANFSYLLFGMGFSSRHFRIDNYSSFGKNSLIDEVYNKNGYLGVVGNVWEHLTEVHYLEKRLNVPYRIDKIFKGSIIDINRDVYNSNIVYFCRDLNLDYSASLLQLKKDIILEDLVETWNIKEYNLKISVIKIRDLHIFIKKKLSSDSKYLLKKISK